MLVATAVAGLAKAITIPVVTGAVASLLPGIVTVSGLITYNRIRNARNRK